MKLWKLLVMGLYAWTQATLSHGDERKAVPPIPADCADGIADQGYCTAAVIPSAGFPISILFFVVVEKDVYPNSKALLDKYLAFARWPEYVESTASDNIVFTKSIRMKDKTDAQGKVIARHYYDYKLKSPIGYQKVRGVTHNVHLKQPYQGAVSTTEFIAQTSGTQEVPAGEKPLTGAEGLKLQTGSLNLVSCTGTGLCSSDQWLVIYESSITPAINLLPKVVATSVENGITDVIVGMLFN
ncbi:hypothetical protein [Oligoflexus tunisiensis]|uniref:hypothetical protein n=1 Tax=Oligoflexus tunisiensis TaxID=708132 RepID=UPI00114CC659|nr:hypothetical protein [Oligoflexus tunisiensis]